MYSTLPSSHASPPSPAPDDPVSLPLLSPSPVDVIPVVTGSLEPSALDVLAGGAPLVVISPLLPGAPVLSAPPVIGVVFISDANPVASGSPLAQPESAKPPRNNVIKRLSSITADHGRGNLRAGQRGQQPPRRPTLRDASPRRAHRICRPAVPSDTNRLRDCAPARLAPAAACRPQAHLPGWSPS
jgi:hypothetical protein